MFHIYNIYVSEIITNSKTKTKQLCLFLRLRKTDKSICCSEHWKPYFSALMSELTPVLTITIFGAISTRPSLNSNQRDPVDLCIYTGLLPLLFQIKSCSGLSFCLTYIYR